MPVYAPTPGYADRRLHPRALVLIIAGHAALVAAVITAKMDLPVPFVRTPTEVRLIPLPEPPPPEPQPQKQPQPQDSIIDRPVALAPLPLPSPVPLDSTPIPLPIPDPGSLIGNGVEPAPLPIPHADPVRTGPRFVTRAEDIRPPYPEAKRRTGEEAALKLRLTIDERGRVVAVEPVGKADRAFLEAARRHLIAHWRYKPATEDGKAVSASTVITLRFELE